MSRAAVLAVPACAPGLGGGHLVRCAALVRELRALGREAALFIPADAERERVWGFLGASHFDPGWIACESDLREKKWECVILDRFRTPPEECRRWARLAPVVAIDEGGPWRGRFDFLIDILPSASRIKPNVSDSSLLPLPKRREPREALPDAPRKALVSFGQEDSAGLGLAAARELAAQARGNLEITLLSGALRAESPSGGEEAGAGFKAQAAIPNLRERLRDYDLLVTHFGLTAFEALYAGIPALLLSPTRLHEKIARKAAFVSAGMGKGKAKKLARLLFKNGAADLAFYGRLKKRCAGLAKTHGVDRAPRVSLAELANGFAPDVSANCAACGSRLQGAPLARFPERSYRRCKRCGTISMSRLTPAPIEYGREYFFESYRRQYGKTYVEDFPNLTAMARRRLAEIRRLLPAKAAGAAPALLDIGCAYGPFLAAARDEGFSPRGIDPAQDAVEYVAKTLGISAEQGVFRKGVFGAGEFDAVTLWYVAEHFRDCAEALAEIRRILKPGGALALSTPSFAGVSGRASPGRFLERSPADHWTVWSPASCRKALAAAGFKVRKIVVTGHHPERFPVVGKYARDREKPLHRLLLVLSKLFRLGDTFEAYAVAQRAP